MEPLPSSLMADAAVRNATADNNLLIRRPRFSIIDVIADNFWLMVR